MRLVLEDGRPNAARAKSGLRPRGEAGRPASLHAPATIESRLSEHKNMREEMMIRRTILASAVALMTTCLSAQAEPATAKPYNTVKQKLIDGKQVVGGTVFSPD